MITNALELAEILLKYDMERGLVSIITPMYKGAKFVGDTIESVLKQTYANWEMIIVDDCSPDDGAGIAEVRKYAEKEKRIKLIASPVNKGSSGARNIALHEAQGRYITFLDSDDIWSSDFLESQLNFMKEKSAALVTASYHRINEQGIQVLQPFIVPEKVNYWDILKSNPISCLTTIYDREVVSEHYFREELKSLRDDYAFWLEILKDKVDYVYGNPKILASYRLVSTSVTRNRKKLIKPQFLIYYQVEKLGLLRSIYYFMNWAIRSVFKYS